MIQYICDVCGQPMPADYVRHKHPAASIMTVCGIDDVCTDCIRAGATVPMTEILMGEWRKAINQGNAAEKAEADAPPELLRERDAAKKMSESDAAFKADITDRLKAYRGRHGLGCLTDVSKRTRAVTDGDLRDIINGEAKLSMDQWGKVNLALKKAEKAEEDGKC